MGYFFALFFLFKFVLQQKTKEHLLPYFIPVAIAIFPLNAHMAFYGSIWASMIWLLTSLCFAKAKNLV
jgi:asparagine N-glycosylation enzyme membrane subunit Stt3